MQIGAKELKNQKAAKAKRIVDGNRCAIKGLSSGAQDRRRSVPLLRSNYSFAVRLLLFGSLTSTVASTL
jgi:hypothetical protein